jgi:hypothetical protein
VLNANELQLVRTPGSEVPWCDGRNDLRAATKGISVADDYQIASRPLKVLSSLPFSRSRNLLLAIALAAGLLRAGEGPYFITYDHHLEEPGTLEISLNPVFGVPKLGNAFVGSWTEFEYGVKGWWTTEFYLDGQATARESMVFTGFRWENRFRPLMDEHRINPVLYVEYENLNGADKSLKEVVGFDSGRENDEPNSARRKIIQREIEAKLILSSQAGAWNISQNFIAEKNLISSESWQFGYAFGVNRPLALAASPDNCNFCRENFRAGVELYGGLGDRHDFALGRTSHYLAPVLSWTLENGMTLKVSPAFGLTPESHRALIRLGIAYELPAFGRRVREMLP